MPDLDQGVRAVAHPLADRIGELARVVRIRGDQRVGREVAMAAGGVHAQPHQPVRLASGLGVVAVAIRRLIECVHSRRAARVLPDLEQGEQGEGRSDHDGGMPTGDAPAVDVEFEAIR